MVVVVQMWQVGSSVRADQRKAELVDGHFARAVAVEERKEFLRRVRRLDLHAPAPLPITLSSAGHAPTVERRREPAHRRSCGGAH
jgi:hypothetical protein